ncbi:3-phosphoshikimate 1-carboxyvinyltransferase [Cyclobacterium qasimii]|uniref:3-phosphoshikimate 1-carboxyvinyltransferase n=2 Tax=Cyclobacterium qasimii TaxID=1350429 RepID=S7WPS6_9BACT|nr:3-phosphoshikimate 1-carboxyvinyltransferase [Cyclobacterium qasimii]EPR68739.1 5-Enolpyruvylshikimate-3-phosphate synthase [Cyclobacterium qasimii M12-11B]GEO22689.1 3-phosphoshikimate 1-carboxyvinyltransferase [Cyclobacterium qasimii]
MNTILLPKKSAFGEIQIPLPSSKSESNRVLIIDALTEGGNTLSNLAEARDTQTMIRLLEEDPDTYDVLDAGTTMRFLTAYAALNNRQKTMTGTPRMCERPIGILVDALKEIGASISYLKKEGYPPLTIEGFTGQKTKEIEIRGDVSSQYISALLMNAPLLPEGLVLNLTGKIGSRTYITMTLELMKAFGVDYIFEGSQIKIKPGKYQSTTFSVESDWSGASYWFSLLACADSGVLFLKGLKAESLQGDAKIVTIMDKLGVESEFTSDGILLKKKAISGLPSFDFTHCPDLAQTVAVTCALTGQTSDFTGLESLRIKETDRIDALQKELAKIGALLEERKEGVFTLVPATNIPDTVSIATYDDHRMAMAFMPLITRTKLEIEDPEVVNKSYPSFWKHCSLLDIQPEFIKE